MIYLYIRINNFLYDLSLYYLKGKKLQVRNIFQKIEVISTIEKKEIFAEIVVIIVDQIAFLLGVQNHQWTENEDILETAEIVIGLAVIHARDPENDHIHHLLRLLPDILVAVADLILALLTLLDPLQEILIAHVLDRLHIVAVLIPLRVRKVYLP